MILDLNASFSKLENDIIASTYHNISKISLELSQFIKLAVPSISD